LSYAHVLLGVFILLAYTAEAMTGFGSIVIALSLGALLFPIEWLQTILVPLNIFMTGFLAYKYRRQIDVSLLGKLVLPAMLIGTLVGFATRGLLAGALLKGLFAVLILWFAMRELGKLQNVQTIAPRPLWLSRIIVFSAGVTHGWFASGGPLLVYGLAGMSLDKARFRATLIVVWFVLNSMLTLLFAYQGALADVWTEILMYLPLIPLGIFLGDKLHHHIDELGFRRWIYRLLVVAALGLLSATLMPFLVTA
jgi:uncharacterized membrane protein YfcA